DDLPVVIAHLHEVGVPVFFRFGAQTDLSDATQQIASVDQGGLGLPDRDFYTRTDQQSRETLEQYTAHIETIFKAAEEEPADAAAHAKAAVAIESALAKASLTRVQRREPSNTQHHMALGELRRMMPAFDWAKYVTASSAPKFQLLNVAVP